MIWQKKVTGKTPGYHSFTDEDMYRDVSFPTQAMADAYDYGYGQKIGNLYDANTGTIPSYALGYGVKRNGTRVITSATNPHEQFAGGDLVGFRTHYTYVDTTYNSIEPQTYLLEAYLRGGYTNMIAEFNSRSETANVVIYEVAQ